MTTLHSLIPTAEQLLAMSPQDIAPVLLKLVLEKHQGSSEMFWPDGITQEPSITGERNGGYPAHLMRLVDARIGETWAYLKEAD